MMWMGIDTHLKTHEVEIQNNEGKKMWSGRINNDRKGFEYLLEKMRTVENANSQKIGGIFMNPTGNYHMPVKHFLESNGFFVYTVDARRTHHLRMTQNLGKEKSDPEDASVLASTARKDEHALDSKGHNALRESGLTRLLEQLKSSSILLTNLIISDLAAVFPEYADMFSVDAKISLNLLKSYPTPDLINNATEEELYRLMDTGKGHYTREDAVKLKEAAKDTIGIPDPDGIFAYRIIMNAERIESEKNRIKRIESEIARRFSKNSDIERIAEIKGVSRLAASAIVSEIGNIDQFSSPEKLQAYGGKTPNIYGSGGKTQSTRSSRIRNPHLSNTIYECAVSLVLHRNAEFIEIYNREINKGKKSTQAYIVVGKRLIHHIYSMMKNGKPYRCRIPYRNTG